MGKPKQIKSISSRVSESVTLVKHFKELGIVDTEPGLVALREKLNEWIRGAPAWAGRIEFPRYGRYADVVLPDKEGCVCSANFKMHK